MGSKFNNVSQDFSQTWSASFWNQRLRTGTRGVPTNLYLFFLACQIFNFEIGKQLHLNRLLQTTTVKENDRISAKIVSPIELDFLSCDILPHDSFYLILTPAIIALARTWTPTLVVKCIEIKSPVPGSQSIEFEFKKMFYVVDFMLYFAE